MPLKNDLLIFVMRKFVKMLKGQYLPYDFNDYKRFIIFYAGKKVHFSGCRL